MGISTIKPNCIIFPRLVNYAILLMGKNSIECKFWVNLMQFLPALIKSVLGVDCNNHNMTWPSNLLFNQASPRRTFLLSSLSDSRIIHKARPASWLEIGINFFYKRKIRLSIVLMHRSDLQSIFYLTKAKRSLRYQ